MSTLYATLRASRREIRLISIRSDLHKLDSSNTPRDSIPDGALMCTMKTVSLKDWTPDYADFQAKTIDWPYSPATLYEEWKRFSREKSGFMDDDTPTPDRFVWGDYETISYTWENGSNNQYNIYVNDRPFNIKENLYHALQEFRRSKGFVESRKQMLWADAICINQDDLDERATEVKRMYEIFSTARRSTIWLGHEVKGVKTKPYFDLVNRLMDNLCPSAFADESSTDDVQPTSTELASSKAGTPNEHDQKDKESRELSEEVLAMLSQFDPAERPPTSMLPTLTTNERLLALLFPILRLKYWNRVWIIQELAASSSQTIVRVGSSQMSFARLSWFAERFMNAAKNDPDWSPDDIFARNVVKTLYLLETIYEIRLQLEPDEWETTLIIQGLMSRSSLPLDKLYGLLNLLQPATYFGLDVDYKKTVRQGSIDTAIALIRASKTIKSFVIRKERQSLQVPSWVVDLSVNHDPMWSLALYFHHRSPADIPEVDWDVFWERQVGLGDQGILSLSATYLDTVDGTAACVPVESEGLKSWPLLLRNIDDSATEPTRIRHSYRDDSEMLAQLDAILRTIPNWQTDEFENRCYAEGSPDAFQLGTLAVSVELGSNGSCVTNALGVSAVTATELFFLKQFLDASADFKLWKDKLSSFFPGIGQKTGTLISARQTLNSANLLAIAVEDTMQHINLWTLTQVRLITTTSGYLGVAAQLVRGGDRVYAVEGYGCPVILRPIKDANTFEFVGLAEIRSPAVSGTWKNMLFDSIVRLQ
ncbi:Heterokaryon incompatibility protein 6, OR allele [Colletotrichum tropicale]|nr:Heterokaryon incompatibility protein 6, OR allele [Colletotrichum tropicale]